jgi:hypothetical protein
MTKTIEREKKGKYKTLVIYEKRGIEKIECE